MSSNSNNITIAIVRALCCLLVFSQLWFGPTSVLRHKNSYVMPTSTTPSRKGPFKMPRIGPAYDIFQPLYDMNETKKNTPLIVSPSEFIKTFEERISWVDTMVSKSPKFEHITPKQHATTMYIEMMKSFVSAVVFNDAELMVIPAHPKADQKQRAVQFNKTLREKGSDWAYSGDTMVGTKRLDNIFNLLTDVISNDIKGDYIETGVWRGGASIFAKAVISALEDDPNDELETRRVSYVADSFKGLPPGDKVLHKGDKHWDEWKYLEVSVDTVANNFIKYGLLDSNVVFAKGFFNETMPPLSTLIQSLSVIRLDVSVISYSSTSIHTFGNCLFTQHMFCLVQQKCHHREIFMSPLSTYCTICTIN